MTSTALAATLIRDLYARMLLTRIVDEQSGHLHAQGRIDFVASCRGHEAAQVGSAICIEVGKDFTLPYYRDLGVVLTIGMTPYEVFRTYLQAHQQIQRSQQSDQSQRAETHTAMPHWGYHKHNMVTGPAPVATQLLHAAGIAFASKLRKASVVTVAYCGDGATTETDFAEALRFAALHQLPVIFICEQDCTQSRTGADSTLSCMHEQAVPAGLTHQCIDGTDVVEVYTAMHAAMEHAREGHGPVLLEMHVTRSIVYLQSQPSVEESNDAEYARPQTERDDPLIRCQHILQVQGAWDDAWATQLSIHITSEVQNAMHVAMRDMLQPG